MEWVLQAADELDDLLAAVRHGWLGLTAELGPLSLVGIGIGAALAGPALGAEPALIGAAAISANIAALLKIRGSRMMRRA
jgi:hypothetical protein